MTSEELVAAAGVKNVNPYLLAWELCGSPQSEFWGDLPWMYHFRAWNKAQWAITSARTRWPSPCCPDEHLKTLAQAVTAQLEAASVVSTV